MTESNEHNKGDRDWQNAGDLRRVLDESTERIPDAIQARLRQARMAAVSAKAAAPATAWQFRAAWYGVAASLALAVTVGLLWPDNQPDELADEEMLYAMAELGDEEWSVVRDLEFVYWLSEQPDENTDDARRSADRPG